VGIDEELIAQALKNLESRKKCIIKLDEYKRIDGVKFL
jgi:hypothetical protein